MGNGPEEVEFTPMKSADAEVFPWLIAFFIVLMLVLLSLKTWLVG